MQHGVKRSEARHGNGRRRETLARIGVEGLIGVEIAFVKRAVEARAHAVDHRRISLQAHPLLEAINEYRRHKRAVSRASRFLLDKRSKRQRLIGRSEREVRRSLRPRRSQPLLHELVGTRQQRCIGRPIREKIGVREKQPLRLRLCCADAAQQLVVGKIRHDLRHTFIRFEGFTHIAEGPPFNDGECALRDIALGKLGQQAEQRRARADFVVARLDVPIDARCPGERHHDPVGRNDASAGKFAGDGAQRRSGPDVKCVSRLRKAQRIPRRPRVGSGRDEQHKGEQPSKATQHRFTGKKETLRAIIMAACARRFAGKALRLSRSSSSLSSSAFSLRWSYREFLNGPTRLA